MVLQLVTAGGTFPWQTLPAPLAALHHVLPMGYVVDAMRQVMYGGDLGRAGTDALVLLAWLVGAVALAAIGHRGLAVNVVVNSVEEAHAIWETAMLLQNSA